MALVVTNFFLHNSWTYRWHIRSHKSVAGRMNGRCGAVSDGPLAAIFGTFRYNSAPIHRAARTLIADAIPSYSVGRNRILAQRWGCARLWLNSPPVGGADESFNENCETAESIWRNPAACHPLSIGGVQVDGIHGLRRQRHHAASIKQLTESIDRKRREKM